MATMLRLPLISPSDILLPWKVFKYSTITAILLPHRTARYVASTIQRYAFGPRDATSEAETRRAEIKLLLQDMHKAETLIEYEKCTNRLDVLQDHDEWKRTKDSIEPSYNPDAIQRHMEQLQAASDSCDLSAMQHLLRTSLSRDLGGMNMLRLYKHSWFGTKRLIDEYIDTATDTIEKFVDSAIQYNVSTSEIAFYQQSLEDALKYFGRSALTLSGGALVGMKHVGVVKTLWEADLLPEVISGASAGSIVAAIVGSTTDKGMEAVLQRFPDSDLACFDPPNTSRFGWFRQRASVIYSTRALFVTKNLERVMKDWLGNITFREAHYKTGRILNISISSYDDAEPRILNYVTAPDVYIWSAVCASCSVPFVFPSATIFEKDALTQDAKVWMQSARQLFVDGSLDSDIPTRKLSEMFNVNFFIVSQVNAHVRFFLAGEERFRGQQPVKPSAPRAWFQTAKTLLAREIVHRFQQCSELGAPSLIWRWASVLKQQYTGDINVLPPISRWDYLQMLANPDAAFIRQATIDGERATWPRMCRIKNCVAIELALVRGINALRERVNFGPEARAARAAGQRASRGRISSRDRSGRDGSRPAFLRRRSLSTEHHNGSDGVVNEGQALIPAPGPTKDMRRNQSLGSMSFSERMAVVSSVRPPLLSPQAGVDSNLTNASSEDGLVMAMRPPRSQGP